MHIVEGQLKLLQAVEAFGWLRLIKDRFNFGYFYRVKFDLTMTSHQTEPKTTSMGNGKTITPPKLRNQPVISLWLKRLEIIPIPLFTIKAISSDRHREIKRRLDLMLEEIWGNYL